MCRCVRVVDLPCTVGGGGWACFRLSPPTLSPRPAGTASFLEKLTGPCLLLPGSHLTAGSTPGRPLQSAAAQTPALSLKTNSGDGRVTQPALHDLMK